MPVGRAARLDWPLCERERATGEKEGETGLRLNDTTGTG